MRAEIAGMTKETYDQAISQIETKLRSRSGFIAHLAGPIAGGYRVVEFWESEEALNSWMREEIMPLAARVGIPPFEPRILPADNAFVRSQ